MSSKSYDLICMGRSSIDLYSNDSGAQFKDITSFASFVGGWRSLLHLVDFVIGTQEEIKAAMLKEKSHVTVKDSQVSAPEVLGDEKVCIAGLLKCGPKAVIEKRGSDGAAVHLADGKFETAEPFKVDICNLLGAGDAFASGFIYGYLKGWDWKKCVRIGNATGAIVVTKQGCANFMPTETEALDFVARHGGFATESLGVRR